MVMKAGSDICPYVKKPFSSCHCFDMTSRNIDSAIHYCVNHFRECDIFRFQSTKRASFKGMKSGLTRSIEAS